MRPVVAFVERDVGADANTNVDVDASDNDDEEDGTGSTGVAPAKGETPPYGDSLCRSLRSACMPMLKSRAAV